MKSYIMQSVLNMNTNLEGVKQTNSNLTYGYLIIGNFRSFPTSDIWPEGCLFARIFSNYSHHQAVLPVLSLGITELSSWT